jgi:carbonic anhydrase
MGLLGHLARPLTPKSGAKAIVFLGRDNGLPWNRGAGCPRCAKVEGAKAIVVLGHNFSGAIKSAVDGVKFGNIAALLKNFQPALATLIKADGHRDSHNDPLVQKVIEASVRLTAASLTKRSPVIKALVDAKQLKIPTAMHDITTGKVTWLA